MFARDALVTRDEGLKGAKQPVKFYPVVRACWGLETMNEEILLTCL